MDHALVIAYPPHEQPVAELIESSDALLVLGSDLDAMMTRQFALRLPAHLIQVDVAEAHIGMAYHVQVPIVARVQEAVPAILYELDALDHHAAPDGLQRARAARAATCAGLSGEGRGALPLTFLDALDAALPADAVVVCDMAIAGYWVAGQLPLAPHRRLLYPIGWGTLGFGLPAAIGAAVAAPQSRTVCVAGDAGVLYALGELATAAQEGLPLTLVIVDDSGYGMLRYAAQQRFGRTFAVDLASPNHAAIARGFGMPAWACALDSVEMPEVLSQAMQVDGPAVVVLSGDLVPPRMSILGVPAEPA